MEKLNSLTVNSLRKYISLGSLTPRVVAELSIQRAERTRELNAFTKLTPKEAFSQTSNNEANESLSLRGVPIAVKDNFCIADIPTTCASRMLENFVPTYDATVCTRLFKAGAALIGKCNLDQFAMGSGTVDSIFGPTKNIWHSQFDTSGSDSKGDFRIAGGSSGGCAVAVASGSCIAGIGSDTGGSTRNPAALCGLVGLKPTYGIVSRFGLIPLVNSMDVPGIITRNINDCIEIFNVIAGPDDKDSTTLKENFTPINMPENISLKGIRIGIPVEYHCEGMDPQIINAWVNVADILEKEGAVIEQINLPHTAVSIAVYSVLNQCEVASNMARYDGLEYGLRADKGTTTEELYAMSRSLGLNDVVRGRILAGNYFLLAQNYNNYFMQALRIRRLIRDDFRKAFDKVDVLLTPTTLCEAPLYSDFIKRDNRDQCILQDYCTQPANMAGIPALSLPISLSANSLPISLQLMANHKDERTLFLVAKAIEDIVKFPSFDLNV